MSIIAPDELALLARRHAPDREMPDLCAECGSVYPCPTKRAIVALAAEIARRRYAEHYASSAARGHARGELNYTPWPDLTPATRRHWIARHKATAAPTARDHPANVLPFTVRPGGRHARRP